MTLVFAQVAASFIAPALAAAGAGAVAIPIAIHLLSRLRTRNEPWAAMRFLLEAYRRHRRRLRLEQWLLLLVRCLVVAVAGLALAGPLLSGCVAGLAGGFSPRQEMVHIVLDDTLTSRATELDGRSRFERLREQAIALADAAPPNDRVVLWRSAFPMVGPVEGRDAVRTALADATPRYTASRLTETLQSIDENVKPGQRATVIVLTDASRSVEALGQPVPAELDGLGERASVFVTRPALDADNVQVERLVPRRRVVFAQRADTEVALPVELRLRRFDSATGERSVEVEVAALDAGGSALATATRRARWAVGQTVTGLNLDLTLPPAILGADSDRTVVLRARLDSGSTADALLADDERLAAVDVRRRMHVAIVEESLGRTGGIDPGQWLSLALSPRLDTSGGGGGVIDVRRMLPADVNPTALTNVDAVMLLRPDLVPDTAWVNLASFAQAGGVVWVFVPPGEMAAAWVRPMVSSFELPWHIGMEPVAMESDTWTLDTDHPSPQPLAQLGADWESLLRPVRVERRLEVAADDDQVWLAVSGVSNTEALLLARQAGRGAVMLLATALDGAWTNLPTKPLFVPLVHESLRGLLGDATGESDAVLAGQTPALGEAWIGTGALVRVGAMEGGQPASIALRRTESGMVAAEPIIEPGLYRADGQAGLPLPVNVPADAGDSRTYTEQQLAQWFDGLGPWSFLDTANPGAALTRGDTVSNLGWPLLLLLLALVVVEMFLARVTSHALAPTRAGLGQRLARVVRHVRQEPDDEASVEPRNRGEAA